jgi:hypothetical protein
MSLKLRYREDELLFPYHLHFLPHRYPQLQKSKRLLVLYPFTETHQQERQIKERHVVVAIHRAYQSEHI